MTNEFSAVNEWRKRIEFLYYIYYESQSNTRKTVMYYGPAERMQRNWGFFDNDRLYQVLGYLEDKGWVTMYPDKKEQLLLAPIEPATSFSVYITHEGVDVIEKAIRESDLGKCLVSNGAAVDWSMADSTEPAASGPAPNISVQADTVIIQNGTVNQASMGDITTGGDVSGRDNVKTEIETKE